MVQTPFTWRYGGREVFLSGSFNGWSERIQLIPLEGSAAVFQRIIDLPPGCYQYKFVVDSEWQVDKHQICDVDEYGTVYNIVLVSGTESMSPDFNAEAFQSSTSGANHREMLSMGPSSGSLCNEPAMQLSDADMDILRQVLSMHLFSAAVYELIPNSGKVLILDVEVDVEQAFHVMYDEGLRVVPLWDEHNRLMAGMLTSSDFILILLQLQSTHAIFSNEDLGRQTVSSWKGWKFQHYRDVLRTLVPRERMPLIHAGPDESLADVASRILQNNISAIPVVHSGNGLCPRLLHIACLSGVLKHVCRHLKHHLGFLTLLQQPVGYLPLGTWAKEFQRTMARPLLTLHLSDSLNDALTMLLEAQISSIPIVDDGGNLVDTYSRSDIISLAKDNMYTHIQLDHMTILQAIEISVDVRRDRLQTCTRFDSLYRVMELLSEPDTRRVIIVEASSRRIEGVITLRDVFHFLSR
ncbi:sucrose nonfermenting 4-like protein isoform X1 [Primulina tabacum]|uniref:sucrose nonfermenting 4-like protein isoform X1 n=2 Tax=Primulina tabacum TaxID=48773 RepID=UPI003F5AADED